MYRIRTFTLVAVAALFACALLPTAASAISRDVVLARGRVWLNTVRVNQKTGKSSVGVPYSQGKWALEDGSEAPTSSPTAGYRTDCSGFVSLCWNLRDSRGRTYSTSTYDMGKNNSSLFKLTPIKQAELQPGDMLLKSTVWYTGSGGGHAIIFAGWSKADMSEYWALEQTGPCTKYSKRPYGQTGYRAFRYDGIDGFDRTRVSYGGAFTVSGTTTRTQTVDGVARSVVATGGVVDLVAYGANGVLSDLVSGVAVDSNGRYSVSYVPKQSGKYALRVHDAGSSDRGQILFPTNVTVAPGVSAVSGAGSKIARKKTYAFYGYTNPRVASHLKIYKYSAKARSYVYYQSVRASTGSTRLSRGYKLTSKWKPRVAGSYRLSWLTATPAGMAAGASGSRYLSVK
jgi:hypothetical protein